MQSHLFWFNDEQWAKIAPHLPTKQPGPQRNDDRLILRGIMHVLKASANFQLRFRPKGREETKLAREVGCRWVEWPREYGPHKTIDNRFARWSERGIWQKIFAAVGSPTEPPKQAARDSSHIKAPRCASGGKGGPKFRRSGPHPELVEGTRAAAIAKSTRLSMRIEAPGC